MTHLLNLIDTDTPVLILAVFAVIGFFAVFFQLVVWLMWRRAWRLSNHFEERESRERMGRRG